MMMSSLQHINIEKSNYCIISIKCTPLLPLCIIYIPQGKTSGSVIIGLLPGINCWGGGGGGGGGVVRRVSIGWGQL